MKILLIIVLILLATVIVFLVWRYVSYARDKNPGKTYLMPNIEKVQIEFSSLTNDESELNLILLVKNHLPFRIKADSMKFGLYINGEELAGSTFKKTVLLKAFGKSEIELPVTLYRGDYDSIVAEKDRNNVDSATYQLKMSFYTNLFFKKKINIDFKEKQPLFHFAKLTTEYHKIESVNFSRTIILLKASIRNDNIFPLHPSDLSYQFCIEGHEWIEGKIPGVTEIKAQETTEFQIPVELPYKEIAATLFDLMKRGKEVKYTVKLDFTINTDMDMISNARIKLENTASVKSLVFKKEK